MMADLSNYYALNYMITGFKNSIRFRYEQLSSCLFPLLLMVFLCYPIQGNSQVVGPVPSSFNSIQQNGVSNMAALGDTLWIGPGLNRNIGNYRTADGNALQWYKPENADSVTDGRGRLFSIDLAPDTVIAGLGYTTEEDQVQTGLGYYLSTDGGEQWNFVALPLDAESDSTIQYGGETYDKLPVVVPQQSPPFGLAFHGDVIFSANWALGVLRSTDFGNSWDRVILPPDDVQELSPERTYEWDFEENGVAMNEYNPRPFNNLKGFEVLVDRQDRVWVGTANGINISPNALTAPIDSIVWRHISFQSPDEGLLSDWVIEMNEQPETGRIWMTNWVANPNQPERFGLVSTRNGEQFKRYLIGERVNAVDFDGNTIVAAGDQGLFISHDNGENWKKYTRIEGPNTFIKASARKLSVASTSERIWVGTDDGIASTADGGDTWEITRVDMPLDGGNQYQEDAPNVDAYAYPNPFSPTSHDLVRIKFEVQQQGNVKIELYDYGMNLIRTIENDAFGPGTYEAVWDGNDGGGRQVANGPVFYRVKTAGGVAKGKILVLD